MIDELLFNPDVYESKECTLDGRSVSYRAWEGLAYCASPLDAIQTVNVFVPEALYRGDVPAGFSLKDAPIFLPNTVGGYMPGPADTPGLNPHNAGPNSIFCALEHGYVVVSPGVRGRTSGTTSTEFFEGSVGGEVSKNTGRKVGRAPAFIVDYKAVVRWIRANADVIPGNTERIITNGTSAGGALSALAGATGNAPDYEPYLQEIGALEGRDDIFAASCYCPIHNLEHADAAYEWLFCGHTDWHRTKHKRLDDGSITNVVIDGVMTDEQVALSAPLKALFPAYVNKLELTDDADEPLSLQADGSGSFADWVKSWVMKSAQDELDTHHFERNCQHLQVAGAQIDEQDYLEVKDSTLAALDWEGFVAKITRMKPAPAFDALDLSSPENEEFGDELVDARHFTAFSQVHTMVEESELADPALIRLMNPTSFIREGSCDIAPHWRVRHGSFDRDTSLAIPVILATLLKNHGYDTDFALPWGLPHSGDYDLDELFVWIDSICA